MRQNKEYRISELEDKYLEVSQTKEKKKKNRKTENSVHNLGDTINWPNICALGLSEDVERE